MKILRVVRDLYPSCVGGTELHAHELSKAQARLGHEVTVLTSSHDGLPEHEHVDGYEVIRIKQLCRPLGNGITPSLLLDLAKMGNGFDIIHAHSHLSFSTNICAAFRGVRSTPLIITNHGMMSQTAPKMFQDLYMQTVAKWTLKSADRIICYTEQEKAEMVGLGIPKKNVAVIHNGINTNLFRPRLLESESKNILWIGRYTPGKGVEYLIHAFAQFHKTHPDFSLLMIGRGPNKDAMIELVQKLGLEGPVKMWDFVPNHEMPDIYRSARAFVLPSLEEGVPRSILEAMACGVPVICTELPQLVNIVSGAGCVVPLRDSQSIAEQLDRIVRHPEWATALGREGVRRARSDHSWDDTVRRTLELYEKVIGIDNDSYISTEESSITELLNHSDGVELTEPSGLDGRMPDRIR